MLYCLRTSRFTPRQLWQQVQFDFVSSVRGYVLFDDIVLDKRHSQRIELVRQRYSGNAHGSIKGISLVNCVYINLETEQFWMLDYRFFAPEADGKTKIDHVADMLVKLAARQIPYSTVFLDNWYAATALFKQLTQVGKFFYCPFKSNSLVDGSGWQQPCQPLTLSSWSATDVAQDKMLNLK